MVGASNTTLSGKSIWKVRRNSATILMAEEDALPAGKVVIPTNFVYSKRVLPDARDQLLRFDLWRSPMGKRAAGNPSNHPVAVAVCRPVFVVPASPID